MRLLIAVFVAVLLILTCGDEEGQSELLVGRYWRLTSHQGNDDVGQPQWSPEGSKITYRARRNIWYVEVIEGTPRPVPITEWAGVNEYPTWHPNAAENKVAFMQTDMGYYTIWVAPAAEHTGIEDAVEVYRTQDQLKYTSFSRDGNSIYYYRLWIESDSTNLVWSVAAEAGGQRDSVVNDEGWDRIYNLQSVPSSDNLLYIDRQGTNPLYYYNIKLMPLAGGMPVGLTDYEAGSPFAIGGVAMSHDGTKVALTMLDSRDQSFVNALWIMDVATGELTQITTPAFNQVSSPAWSPDDKRLAVVRYSNIHIIELEE
jgi:Tol biopolymer transport system component